MLLVVKVVEYPKPIPGSESKFPCRLKEHGPFQRRGSARTSPDLRSSDTRRARPCRLTKALWRDVLRLNSRYAPTC
jgi:hypothetical protein